MVDRGVWVRDAERCLHDQLVDDAPQDLEQAWHAVDLVQDDQFVALRTQVGVGIGQTQAVGGAFQVEVGAASGPCVGQGQGQGGLAHLARPQQHHRRRLLQPGRQGM